MPVIHHDSIEALASQIKSATGTVALIFAEDDVEVAATLNHHRTQGFDTLVLVHTPEVAAPEPEGGEEVLFALTVPRVDTEQTAAMVTILARSLLPGTWVYFGFNAEFLFFPFCEDRTIGEMLAFHTEERRDAMLTYVIDLYAADLEKHPLAVDLDNAHLDKSGYYALPRAGEDEQPVERQLDFYGGLRWRFEEHVPKARRRIDRIALFRAREDLTLRADFTFSDPEYNTYACPWHHNLTAAICSFRTAKALKRNPGSRYDIASFHWHNSEPFRWHSQQLLDLGLMEPGQWF